MTVGLVINGGDRSERGGRITAESVVRSTQRTNEGNEDNDIKGNFGICSKT